MTKVSSKRCSVDGCSEKHFGRGFCKRHYARFHAGRAVEVEPVPTLPNEIWREIPGYEGRYAASNLGRVKSLKRSIPRNGGSTMICESRLLAAAPDPAGYPGVWLGYPGRRTFKVHTLVAAAFLGPCPAGQEVNHKNGDKSDSRLENLEYVTSSQNKYHAFQSGLSKPRGVKGEAHPSARLSEQDVLRIRQLRRVRGTSLAVLATKFGVSVTTISSIVHRETWRHIP